MNMCTVDRSVLFIVSGSPLKAKVTTAYKVLGAAAPPRGELGAGGRRRRPLEP